MTTDERKVITDRIAAVREQLRSNGATALNPTAEWVALRKELTALNGKLK